MIRVIACPDSFKGTLNATAAAQAIASGVQRTRPDAETIPVPMADGGEGTLDAILNAERGNRRRVAAHGPLGDPVEAPVGLIRGASVAVVELACVSGYALVPPELRDPLRTTTYGLGEVVRAAVESDVDEIILAVGGTATVDGGTGMMQALGLKLYDANGRLLADGIGGGQLRDIARFVWDNPPEGLERVRFTIACDVLNPACGVNGAAAVFGPQKGADAGGVQTLDAGLAHWADLLEQATERRLRDEPGTGAAGGVALPLLAMCNAVMVPGVDLVSQMVDLSGRISDADLVLTGEGRLDAQSMMGKVVGAIGRMCCVAEVPCAAIVGAKGDGWEECLRVLDRVYTLDAPMEQTRVRIEQVAATATDELL